MKFIDLINKAEQILDYLYKTRNDTNSINRIERLYKASNKCEKLFIALRSRLIYEISLLPQDYKNEHLILNSPILDIKIMEDETGLYIDMPILLPFKKLKTLNLTPNPDKKTLIKTQEMCNAISLCLDAALFDYLKKNNLDKVKYSKATYIYTNFYNNDYPKKRIPDSDNYEYKHITDTVVRKISNLDDGFENLEFVFRTKFDDRNHTVLKIEPKGASIC